MTTKKQLPPSHYFFPNADSTKEGIIALQKGKVATVILAGGLGSRFGQEMPKGLYPISQIKKKSLFQLVTEKTIAAGKAYGATPRVAIMTSETTHERTNKYFFESNFFGLPQKYISFFSQSSLPLLNDDQQPVITQNGNPLTAPDGNGLFFLHLAASGILDQWKKSGIEYITVLPVDNSLADPFSAELIGLHRQQKSDISIVTIERSDPKENVGIIVEKNGRLSVVEYSEIAFEERIAHDNDNHLKYPLANISFFAFSLSFLEQMAKQGSSMMPLHKIKKQTTALQQQLLGGDAPQELWKSEYFIFDLLAFTDKTSALLLDREDCFYPLKNGNGDYGPTGVQKALLKKDQRQFKAISNTEPPQERLFELSMDFYYPTEALLASWKDKLLPDDDYIS